MEQGIGFFSVKPRPTVSFVFAQRKLRSRAFSPPLREESRNSVRIVQKRLSGWMQLNALLSQQFHRVGRLGFHIGLKSHRRADGSAAKWRHG